MTNLMPNNQLEMEREHKELGDVRDKEKLFLYQKLELGVKKIKRKN